MKKLFSVIILMVITLSVLLSSCTEEVIKVETATDNNGKGEQGDRPK